LFVIVEDVAPASRAARAASVVLRLKAVQPGVRLDAGRRRVAAVAVTSGRLLVLLQRVGCDQEIAADGFFSLGMIADFAGSSTITDRRSIGICSGSRALWGRFCIWRPAGRARNGHRVFL
jgi:hypothetical protein